MNLLKYLQAAGVPETLQPEALASLQRIQFALLDTGFTQRLTVHLKAKCAAVNL